MNRVKRFIQIAPLAVDDGVRVKEVLYALDATGALWCDHSDGSGFVRVEQPPATTGESHQWTTEGL